MFRSRRKCVDCEELATDYSDRCRLHYDLHKARQKAGQPRRHSRIMRYIGWCAGVGAAIFVGYFIALEFLPQEVTAEEYAARACDYAVPGDDATWGQTKTLLNGRLREMKRMKPPAELVPFHEGRTTALEGLVSVLSRKDASARMNELELAFDPDVRTAMRSDKAGVRSLTPQDRQLLRQHGCNI